MFIVVLFIIAKIWKQPTCPLMYIWIKEMYIFIQRNIDNQKKKKILPFTITWRNLKALC